LQFRQHLSKSVILRRQPCGIGLCDIVHRRRSLACDETWDGQIGRKLWGWSSKEWAIGALRLLFYDLERSEGGLHRTTEREVALEVVGSEPLLHLGRSKGSYKGRCELMLRVCESGSFEPTLLIPMRISIEPFDRC